MGGSTGGNETSSTYTEDVGKAPFRNKIFSWFGGRKNFNAYLGVSLTVLWTALGWPKSALFIVLGLLGITNLAIAHEDGKKVN